jgi:hypothetical protein
MSAGLVVARDLIDGIELGRGANAFINHTDLLIASWFGMAESPAALLLQMGINADTAVTPLATLAASMVVTVAAGALPPPPPPPHETTSIAAAAIAMALKAPIFVEFLMVCLPFMNAMKTSRIDRATGGFPSAQNALFSGTLAVSGVWLPHPRSMTETPSIVYETLEKNDLRSRKETCQRRCC